MAEQYILAGKALWCFEHELQQANLADEFRVMLSFTLPLHYHEGQITLSEAAIIINGDVDLAIPLSSLEQLCLGFDDVYKRMYVKNGGLFWQPLKVSYTHHAQTQSIYLIIDYNWFTVKNQLWYNTLTAMFE